MLNIMMYILKYCDIYLAPLRYLPYCQWLYVCLTGSWNNLYIHPSEHSLFFFLQPHREVVQPVLHLQPFRSWMMCCLTASKVRDSSVTFHQGGREPWLLLAFFHMSSTQHVNLQWRYSASVLEIISLSNCIQSQISLVLRPLPAFCRLQYGKGGRGPGIFSHVSDIGIERMVERV